MVEHISPGKRFDDSHGNVLGHRRPAERITVRKVAADSVPYGADISRNGKTVWAAYDRNGVLVAVGASASEARAKYRSIMRAEGDREKS